VPKVKHKELPATLRMQVRRKKRDEEATQRKRAIGGGVPDELGVIQGQNGEQGNTVNPRNAGRRPYVAH
jgi:hypothetical protein